MSVSTLTSPPPLWLEGQKMGKKRAFMKPSKNVVRCAVVCDYLNNQTEAQWERLVEFVMNEQPAMAHLLKAMDQYKQEAKEAGKDIQLRNACLADAKTVDEATDSITNGTNH